MLSKRRTWLERIANWGTALAVPLVAIGGFRLLAHARDGAAPAAGATTHVAAAVTDRVLAPPIDASAPPVVVLRPSAAGSGPAPARPADATGEDPRCAALEHALGASDDEARRAEARTLHCRVR
jgi:hypothetical protein